MKQAELKVGRVYLLVGGHLMRYQGLYANEGPCLAFSSPLEAIMDLPTGYSASAEEVIREVTSSDREWLNIRVAALRSRGLPTAGVVCVLRELG